jgi:phosphopantothenoylcysteine decarboxylase/phosphopantothenate--cysteine ligase
VLDDAMKSAGKQTVLLGITGSIAAYKACELVRLYQNAGLNVKVIMTKHAQRLVGAATFRALTGNAVATRLFDDPGNPINHISLAQEADVLVIAPCTANVLNKIAHGVADDLLSTTALATTVPSVLAPAMNAAMLKNPVTQESLRVLEVAGATIVGPGKGYLACGTEDSGRMSSPEEICAATLRVLAQSKSLAGKRVLITAGPTREYLDPVRYISSPSSGKTGFALAHEAAQRGAAVVLISGPTKLLSPLGIEYVPVTTAEQMLEKASEHFDGADIAIFSAAVGDFRPVRRAEQKLKKGEDSSFTFDFSANPDILATLAARRNAARANRPYIVGFAAETEHLLQNAEAKRRAKGADLIIANDVSDPRVGFASDNNRILFVDDAGSEQTELMSKQQLAAIIFDHIQQKL